MAIRALLHFPNNEPVLCEIDKLPETSDTCVTVRNATKRDGKLIDTLADGVTSIVYPINQITFIELFGEDDQREAIVGFFRESRPN